MGLDMYLSAERFVSGYEHDTDEDFSKILGLLNLERSDAERSMTINVTVGYWRKANAIHNWFVQNVQSGEDNCARYYVSREKLTELRDECRAALVKLEAGDDSGAEDILPPTSGFFFGSTEIDSWYKKDLEHTVNVLEKVLSPKFDKFDFTYRSSW